MICKSLSKCWIEHELKMLVHCVVLNAGCISCRGYSIHPIWGSERRIYPEWLWVAVYGIRDKHCWKTVVFWSGKKVANWTLSNSKKKYYQKMCLLNEVLCMSVLCFIKVHKDRILCNTVLKDSQCSLSVHFNNSSKQYLKMNKCANFGGSMR